MAAPIQQGVRAPQQTGGKAPPALPVDQVGNVPTNRNSNAGAAGADRVTQGPETKESGGRSPRANRLIEGLTQSFGDAPQNSAADLKNLNEDQLGELEHMRKVDKSVKEHEEAHEEVAGEFAKGTSYTRKTGPDGKAYRVAGKVMVDMSETDDPKKTIAKMEKVALAARAPEGRECATLCPLSDADKQVEAKALTTKAKAERQLAQIMAGEKPTEPIKSGVGGAQGA